MGLSLAVGLWHFIVPQLFQWYEYIPPEYQSLIVAIDWVNFLFSLLLSGLSLLLIAFGRKMLTGNRDLLPFYAFLVLVWFSRVLLTFIEPWPLAPVAAVSYGQQVAAILILLLLGYPLVSLLRINSVFQNRGARPTPINKI